ncbi:MAG: hypothetical protein K9K64_02955 [Desulfohalobiaceae bacterium]|nr:hypothetical protein [Desulfohalobiaceae bacterium]
MGVKLEAKETTQRMQAEYIMIGTLWSFAYGIAVSFGTYQLLLSGRVLIAQNSFSETEPG